MFGSNSKPYGWSKDISNRVRSYLEASKPELKTLIEFPPSPLSKFCKSPSSDTLCEVVTWSVLTGPGKFFLRIFIGDPSVQSVNNLKVNDKYIVQNQIVARNVLKVFEEIVEANSCYINFSPECKANCEYAVTKLNAVEIIPYKENMETVEAKSSEVKICGNGFVGGRCENGPNVVHCVYDDPSNPVASNCNGRLMLMEVPNSNLCKDQIGKYKCVMVIFA